MSDFIREIEEDLHDERIINLWRQYGNYLIGAAVVIVLGTAGYSFWKYMNQRWQHQAYEDYSNAVRLVRVGKKDEALKIFEQISAGRGGYAKLAELYQGALLANPIEIYTKMAKQNVSDPALSNLPKVILAAKDINNPEVLEPLVSLTAPHNAWGPLSLEILAFSKLKKGEDVKAAEDYIRIVNEGISTLNERSRAGLMLSQMDIPAHLLEDQSKEGNSQ